MYNVFIFVFEGKFRVYCVHALIHVFLVHWYTTPPGGGATMSSYYMQTLIQDTYCMLLFD